MAELLPCVTPWCRVAGVVGLVCAGLAVGWVAGWPGRCAAKGEGDLGLARFDCTPVDWVLKTAFRGPSLRLGLNNPARAVCGAAGGAVSDQTTELLGPPGSGAASAGVRGRAGGGCDGWIVSQQPTTRHGKAQRRWLAWAPAGVCGRLARACCGPLRPAFCWECR